MNIKSWVRRFNNRGWRINNRGWRFNNRVVSIKNKVAKIKNKGNVLFCARFFVTLRRKQKQKLER